MDFGCVGHCNELLSWDGIMRSSVFRHCSIRVDLAFAELARIRIKVGGVIDAVSLRLLERPFERVRQDRYQTQAGN